MNSAVTLLLGSRAYPATARISRLKLEKASLQPSAAFCRGQLGSGRLAPSAVLARSGFCLPSSSSVSDRLLGLTMRTVRHLSTGQRVHLLRPRCADRTSILSHEAVKVPVWAAAEDLIGHGGLLGQDRERRRGGTGRRWCRTPAMATAATTTPATTSSSPALTSGAHRTNRAGRPGRAAWRGALRFPRRPCRCRNRPAGKPRVQQVHEQREAGGCPGREQRDDQRGEQVARGQRYRRAAYPGHCRQGEHDNGGHARPVQGRHRASVAEERPHYRARLVRGGQQRLDTAAAGLRAVVRTSSVTERQENKATRPGPRSRPMPTVTLSACTP